MFNSGRRGKRSNDGYGIISQAEKFIQTEYPIPIINSFSVTDISYNPTGALAANTAGGETIVINGSGFAPGATIQVGSNTISVVTYVDQGRLAFTAPAASAGSYTIYVSNSNGGTGILVPGLTYSSVPTFQTNAGSLASYYETQQINQPIVATGDAPLTYSLLSGSLPTGSTLSSSGVITGTAPADGSSTTYTFTARAFDAQSQTVDRQFSLTINTDVVTWLTPTSNYVISSYEYVPISNVTASATSAAGYGVLISANTLPAGITLNANTGLISGTNNTVGNTFTRLTATANTTNRSATRDVIFNVNQDVVTWSSPADATQYSLLGGSPISNVSLSATSAAGRTISYTANTLPSGVSLSGSTISGTPDTAQTVFTLLTATANTTNRSATRTISWSVTLGDLNWKHTVMLLSADTPSPSFINDASLNNAQLTIFGDTKPSNFDPYMGSYYSVQYNGTVNDVVNIPHNTSLSIMSGSTNTFVAECWVYWNTVLASSSIMDKSGRNAVSFPNWAIELDANKNIRLQWGASGSPGTSAIGIITTSVIPVVGKWYHIAVVKSNADWSLFVDGVRGATYNGLNTANDANPAALKVGFGLNTEANATYLNGYISNVRVYNGPAAGAPYSATSTTITIPTAPFTNSANVFAITNQSYRFLDNSILSSTITPGSGVRINSAHPFTTPTTVAYNTGYSTTFDGTGDYLTATTSSNLAMSGDFTVEFWLYNSYAGWGSYSILGIVGSGKSRIYTDSSSFLHLYNGASGLLNFYTGISDLALNTWHHFAFSRIGSTLKFFTNGTARTMTTADGAVTETIDFNGSLTIGGISSVNNIQSGMISNLRIINGTGLYSSNFTPPTSTLTAVTNTALLTCQSSRLIDNSPNAYAITSSGDARPITLSPFTMTTSNTTVTSLGSAYFDGTGDYLTTPTNAAFTYGTGDFTIEMWIYITANPADYAYIYAQGPNSPASMSIYIQSGKFNVWNGSNIITGSTSYLLNTWYHVALTRSGTSLKLFLNGVQDGTSTNSSNVTTGSTYGATIGRWAEISDARYFTGYVSDCRVIKGTALYTANFLPPQAPLTPVANTQLLTVQTNGGPTNNYFVDQSSFNNFITRTGNATQGTFSPYSQTGWSNYFDGNGDYLTVPGSSAFVLAGDYTIEAWIHSSSTTWSLYSTGGSGAADQFSCDAGTLYWAYDIFGGGTANFFTSSDINKWTHIAASRSSGTTRLFKNGVVMATSTTNSSIGSTNTVNIGRRLDGVYSMNGYISNFRIVKGTALYTSAFTPSTTPLSPVANTLLLTSQDNRFIDESNNNFTITRNGDVSVQAFSPFGGVTSVPTSYSTLFTRSSSDFISSPASSAFAFGTGAYTIEAWVNFSSIATYLTIFEVDDGTNGPKLTTMADGSLRLWNGSGTFSTTSAGIVTTNTWYHFAWVRESTSLLKLYINGTSVISVTSGAVVSTDLTGTPTVKIGTFTGFGHFMNGYVSNFRITKGQALYTSTFTPSTSPLTTTSQGATSSNVSLLTCQSITMIDNSTNNFTITASASPKQLTFNPFGQTNTTQVSYTPSVNGGSMFFDGTGDNVYAASIPKYGSANHTIECWVYFNNVSGRQSILNQAWSTGSYALNGGWTLDIAGASAGGLSFALGSMSSGAFWIGNASGVGSFTVGQWYHIAIVRNGTTVTIYSNGVSIATGTLTNSSVLMSNMGVLRVGAYDGDGFAFNGYITDVRVSSGALYTSNFVPPVAPLAPTTTIGANTFTSGILLNGTSGGIIDYHGTNNLETVGDVRLANTSPYGSTGKSIYFDGTGDYMRLYNLTNLSFGTGDFTVEFWVYFNSVAAHSGFLGSTGTGGYDFCWRTTDGLNIGRINTAFDNTFAWTPTTGQWYHVAYSRSGTSLRAFVNGLQVGTTATNSISYNPVTAAIVGASTSVPDRPLNGYIKDLRITKGVARYTANTSVSTTPFAVK